MAYPIPLQDRPDFQRRQYEFAAHIRDPLQQPPADVPPRRMAVYSELFFNNIEGLLAEGFPILRRIVSNQQWEAMVRDFFVRHRCRSPLFLEIGREFLDYLAQEREDTDGDRPFLRELAHYEWVELALMVSDADRAESPVDVAGNLLTGHPRVSPLAWSLCYRFPVHRIGPDFQPAEPGEQPTYLLAYRDREDTVRFMEINAVTDALLKALQQGPPSSGREVLMRIAQAMAHPRPELVIEFGHDLLEELQTRGVILGVDRRRSDAATTAPIG